MKVSLLASALLLISILLFSIFFAGREINARIEESITNNYLTEINALKEKLNKQSELINSIIEINGKSEEGENADAITDNSSTTESSANAAEFEYIKENGGITITKYNGKQTSVSIPNAIEQLPVLKIGENAFADSKIKSVTVPSSCKEIDWFAFYGCFALTTVYIGPSVSSIGYGAFEGCSKSIKIYCESNSFAEKYAQSFGISYFNYN